MESSDIYFGNRIGDVNIKFVNNFGETINILSTDITIDEASLCGTNPTTTLWLTGEEWDPVFMGCLAAGYIPKERVEAKGTKSDYWF